MSSGPQTPKTERRRASDHAPSHEAIDPMWPPPPPPRRPGRDTSSPTGAIPPPYELLPRGVTDRRRNAAPSPEHDRRRDERPATLEFRQGAGLTAGMILKLTQSSYTFPDQDSGVGFAITVHPDQGVLVTPGTAPASIEGSSITEPTALGSSILDLGNARFLALPHRPRARPEDWADLEAAVNQPKPIVTVPPALIEPQQRRGLKRLRGHRPEPDQGPEGPAGREFLDQIGSARSQIASRARHLFPDPAELYARANGNSPTLRSRPPGHPLFAQVGVLWADIAWTPTFDQPDLMERYQGPPLEPLLSLPSIPIPVDFTQGPVGLVGPRESVLAGARYILISLYALSSADLSLHVSTPSQLLDDWAWATPIARSTQARPDTGFSVVTLDGPSMFEPARMSHNEVIDHQVGLMVLAPRLEDLPSYTTTALVLDREGMGVLTNHQGHQISGTPLGVTERLAQSLVTELTR